MFSALSLCFSFLFVFQYLFFPLAGYAITILVIIYNGTFYQTLPGQLSQQASSAKPCFFPGTGTIPSVGMCFKQIPFIGFVSPQQPGELLCHYRRVPVCPCRKDLQSLICLLRYHDCLFFCLLLYVSVSSSPFLSCRICWNTPLSADRISRWSPLQLQLPHVAVCRI